MHTPAAMHTPATTAGRATALGRRGCALLAATSAALHAVALGHAANAAALVLMLAMIAGCLLCARDLWRDGATRAWVLVAVTSVAMIALHMPSAGHHHGSAAAGVGPPAPPVMTVAMGIAAVEVAIAAAVLYRRSRVTARGFRTA